MDQHKHGEKPSRQWLKFSLRGLILLTVGVAVFLGGRASRQTEINRLNAQQQQTLENLDAARMRSDRSRRQAVEYWLRAEQALTEALDGKVMEIEDPPATIRPPVGDDGGHEDKPEQR